MLQTDILHGQSLVDSYIRQFRNSILVQLSQQDACPSSFNNWPTVY